MNHSLLSIKNLQISYGGFRAVKNVTFDVNKGEILGLVGESGCGKSSIAESILFPHREFMEGEINFLGMNLLKSSPRKMQKIRGKKISMIFQDPLTSLNPTMPIGKQIQEILRQHAGLSKQLEGVRVVELLNQVGIADPDLRLSQFPFQFSGGMRQRIMIAIAIACNPELIIADEPTTALDVTIQAQILVLLKQLCLQKGTGMLFITHDLGVVAGLCDRLAVMKEGEIVEIGPVDQIFYHPKHSYTKQLISLHKNL